MWGNFCALRAPANFESNFGKSLAGPSGMGGAASGRAENPCGKSTRMGHSTTISHVHYDVHDSSRASQEPTGSPSAAGASGSSTIACGGDRTHPSFTHVHAATESPGDARTERSARSGTAGRARGRSSSLGCCRLALTVRATFRPACAQPQLQPAAGHPVVSPASR